MRGFSGPGVSTFGGAFQFRGVQTGFPARLTSTFDIDTGYDWERLVLAAGVVQAGSIPQTGTRAFAIDGDTSLQPDDIVWLEPDPNAQGWLILATGSGGGISNVCPIIATTRLVTATTDTMSTSDTKLELDATSNNITVTMPAWRDGDFYIFVRIDGTGNTVTIEANGAETIDGAGDFTLSQWTPVTVHTLSSDGEWFSIVSA